MTARPDRMLQHIRRLVSRRVPAPSPDTDAFLLDNFSRNSDEAAFAALVERYGGLVFSVCRRVLGNVTSAEDCTQAVFLVLARKAAVIRRAEELPAWLHGTAYRLALRTRRADLRRLHREIRGVQTNRPSSPSDPLDELTARELLLVLDEELQRLPEVYRLPLILCGLQGLSQEEASAQLGWTPGSLKGRLERGRARLHARLARRGLTLSAALGAVEAARGTVSASLAAALTGPTVQAALAFTAGRSTVTDCLSPQVITLAEGVLKAMSLAKLKMVLLGLAVLGLAGTGLGWWGTSPGKSGLAGTPSINAAEPGDKPLPPPPAVKADKEEREQREMRTVLMDTAKKELRLLTEKAEDLDHELSRVVVDARQRLVEWEEKLRAIDAEPQVSRPSPEEARLLKEEEALYQGIAELKSHVKPEELPKLLMPTQKELERVRQRLNDLQTLRAKLRNERAREVIALRKQIIKLEEDIRLLERKRDYRRAEAERKRDDASERLRQFEGGGGVAAAPDRSSPALERRLKAIENVLSELRQEIRQLRSERKR